jgi:diguanylate cyclase (GGDEF)-like protein/PAS domain S-box-containing protein
MWDAELFDVLQLGLTLSGVGDRRILRANAAACRMAGRDVTDLVGLDWRSVVDAAQFDDLRTTMEQAVTDGGRYPRQIVRLVRPNGTVTHALASGMLVDVGGEQCVLAQLQDITELVSTQLQLQTVLGNVPVAVFLLDEHGQVIARGGPATHDPAAPPGQLDEAKIRAAFRERPDLLARMRRSRGGEHVHEVVGARGRWYDLHLVSLPGTAGRPPAIAGVASDVTDRERATAELLVRTARQTALADLAQRALEIADERTLWELCVQTLTDQLGADRVTVRRHVVGDEPSEDEEPVAESVAPSGSRPPGRHPPGETGHAPRTDHATCPQTDDDEPETGCPVVRIPVGAAAETTATITIRRAHPGLTPEDVAFARSVGAVLGSAVLRIRVEATARFWSLHDPLTGLPNRAALLDRLRRSLRRANRDGRRTGVLFLDLDGFKAVNDTLGHQAGDELLKAVGARLQAVVRPGDVVSRLGGDEFAMLCENIDGLAGLRAIGERVMDELAPAVELHRPVSVGGSVGLALSGPDLTHAEQLLDAADVAMYEAKQGGPGRCVAYDERIRAVIATRLRDTTALRRAFAAGELLAQFQPVADRSNAVVALEAIPCWRHPTRGWLGPQDIDPIAFEAGLSGDLDRWLVEGMISYMDAARDPGRSTSRATGPAEAGLAPTAAGPAAAGPRVTGPQAGRPRELWVRVSDRGLRDADLRKEIIAHAPRAVRPAAPDLVPCVLFPDKLRDEDEARSETIISELAEGGVAVRLDFTELGPLRAVTGSSVPPGLGGIRLSEKHARAVESDDMARAILGSLVHIVHLLRLDVTLRGVDTAAQLAAVCALGCDHFQGAAIGPPFPAPPW